MLTMVLGFLLHHEKRVHVVSSLDGLCVVPGTSFSICVSGKQGKFSMNN